MATELYLLDWQETAYGKQPQPDDVLSWALAQGLIVDGVPRVYANGTVQIECEPSPESLWPSFTPIPQTREMVLEGHVRALLDARAELMALPPAKVGPLERGLLATMALLLVGYGVEVHDR